MQLCYVYETPLKESLLDIMMYMFVNVQPILCDMKWVPEEIRNFTLYCLPQEVVIQ